MVDYVGFLIISTRFVKKPLLQGKARRRHPWIFLTGTAGGVEPFALNDNPHVMAMAGQGHIGLASVSSACDVVYRCERSAPLCRIGRPGDSMKDFGNSRMATAPFLGKA